MSSTASPAESGSLLLIGVGDLGTRIGHCLVQAGRTVTALRRDPTKVSAAFETLGADLTDPESVRRSAGHLAGNDLTVVFTVTAGKRTADAYQRVYVEGMSAVTEILTPGKIVVVSSTAVYDVHDGSWVDETTPATPSAFSGRAMRDMEQIAADRVAEATAVRLSGIYGPGRTRFIDQVRAGTAMFGPEPTYTNRIHVDDAAALVALVARHPSAPAVVIGVDDEPAPRQEVVEWMAAQLDVEVPPVDPEYLAITNKRCRNAVGKSLGFEPMYPTYRQGYASLIG